jgi:hypothetical protein
MRRHRWEEMGHSEKAAPPVSILRLATTGFSGRVVRVGEEIKCYTASIIFTLRSRCRKVTAGSGGVALRWSNVVAPSQTPKTIS